MIVGKLAAFAKNLCGSSAAKIKIWVRKRLLTKPFSIEKRYIDILTFCFSKLSYCQFEQECHYTYLFRGELLAK